jgi:membrane protein
MSFVRFFLAAAKLWARKGADQHAAALAYFTPFALTPLIIFSISIVGIVFGAERVIAMLLRWGNAIDPGVTDLLYLSVQNFDSLATHFVVPLIGLVFLSIMIFVTLGSLTRGLHDLWGVEMYGWRNFVRRLWHIAFFIVILQAYLVFIILLGDTIAYVSALSGGAYWGFVHFIISFISTMMLLAVGYGMLALRAPSFAGRFVGAAVAGFLLLFSRELVALHFTTAPVQSLFGAAGLLIALLVWVYVGAVVILYGAACAYVYDSEPHTT